MSVSLSLQGIGDSISRFSLIVSAPFEGSLMSDEIRGLIGVLRRGHLDWSSFDQARIRADFAKPEGTNRAPLVGGSEDEAEHSRRSLRLIPFGLSLQID